VTVLKDQIIHQLDKLSTEQQKQVLDFTASLVRPRGTPSEVLLQFVGVLSPDQLDEMERAIEDCEKIDLNEW
jgi:hypothetical protein